jgi:effector-binding domain-containing protein
MYFVVAILAIFVLWSLWGYMSSRTEQTAYTVLKSENDYEVRLYPAHIVAQTVVKGSHQSALNQGFGILAKYIFGGNTKKEKIAMTAPVVAQKTSETIAMTAPVVTTIEGEEHTVTFGMPRSYTLETLPIPDDSRIKIVTIPEMKMAVLRFSGFRNSDSISSKKQQLLSALERDKVTVLGSAKYAGYNAPWTPPWLMRNEVMTEIE